MEARIEKMRQQQALQEQQRLAEQQKQTQQEEVTKAERKQELENDERYRAMRYIAYSPMLLEALELYKKKFSRVDGPIRIDHTDINNDIFPLGKFRISVYMADPAESAIDRDTYPEFIYVEIAWRNHPTKRKITMQSTYHYGSRAMYDGVDANSGLGIEFEKKRDTGSNKSNPVFYDLDSLLDYIASLAI